MKNYYEFNFKKIWIGYKITLFWRIFICAYIERSKKDDFVIFKIDYLNNSDNSAFNKYFFFCFMFLNITIFNFFKHEKDWYLKIMGLKIK